ncbi:hypothetical protein Tco_0493100 [Tanacetum coccineum]
MNQDFYNSNPSGFDQYQPPQFPNILQFPQETSKEILKAREDLMEAIQAFLKEYDHISPNEKCMALLLAEERFFKIKQVMEEEQNPPEVMQELLLKLIKDLQILKGIQQEKKKPTAQSLESKVMRECCFVVERDAWLRGEFALSTLDVLQRFGFYLQMGFTIILATLDGLDMGLLGDVIGEDDCDDDG